MIIHVAIPAYDGKVGVETVRALLNERGAADLLGLDLRVSLLPGCSLITMARNQMAAEFREGDADRLVFVDSDVAWEPGDLIRLAMQPVDVVGGAYRFKKAAEDYPVRWLESADADHETGLIEVETLPGGFLAISRGALDRLAEAFPDRAYTHEGRSFHGFFHAPVGNGRIWGEDTAFCNDWRGIGGRVWLDPLPTLTHVGGSHAYSGNVGDWLRSRA